MIAPSAAPILVLSTHESGTGSAGVGVTPGPGGGLTQEGRDAIDAFAPHLQAINDELFDGIGPETFEQFRGIVDHMARTSNRAAEFAENLARDHTQIVDAPMSALGR